MCVLIGKKIIPIPIPIPTANFRATQKKKKNLDDCNNVYVQGNRFLNKYGTDSQHACIWSRMSWVSGWLSSLAPGWL